MGDAGRNPVELEEGRADNPRWAQLQEESVRSHRIDVVAILCRRLAGVLVWGFIAFIFSRLWEVAWELQDLKLLGVCLLVTVSLLYVLVKRYHNVRQTGLSGVELVRAMTVDDTGGVQLRGITRKARAMCVDFKYDPQGEFRVRSVGFGFEVYPQSYREVSSSSSSCPSGPARATATAQGDREEKKEEKEEKEEEEYGGGTWRKSHGRRRGRWPWDRRDRGDDDMSTNQGSDSTNSGEEIPTRQGRRPSATPARRAGTGNSRRTTRFGAAAGKLGPPPPPGLDGGEADRRPVIRACDLNTSCSVCLSDYYLNEPVTLLPCAHLYHTECIDIWMRDHVDCPYCRADMHAWCNGGGDPSRASGPGQTAAAAAPTTAAAASNLGSVSNSDGGSGRGGGRGGETVPASFSPAEGVSS